MVAEGWETYIGGCKPDLGNDTIVSSPATTNFQPGPRYLTTLSTPLDVEDCSEELPRQQSYAIKNQLGHPKPPTIQHDSMGLLVCWFFKA